MKKLKIIMICLCGGIFLDCRQVTDIASDACTMSLVGSDLEALNLLSVKSCWQGVSKNACRFLMLILWKVFEQILLVRS